MKFSMCRQCPFTNPHEDCYDLYTLAGGIAGIAMAVVYIMFIVYLLSLICKSQRIRSNYYSFGFYIFATLGLAIRVAYFPGSIEPLCYGYELYNVLADYPALAQSLSIISLIGNYCEIIEMIQIEHKTRYNVLKKIAFVFAVLYSIAFAITHTVMLKTPSATWYYATAAIGQSIILITFILLSWDFTVQLTKIYSLFFTGSIKILLHIFAFLLSSRIVFSILNVSKVTSDLMKKEEYFIVLLVFLISFEICPAIVLLMLAKLQERQRCKIVVKRKVAASITVRTLKAEKEQNNSEASKSKTTDQGLLSLNDNNSFLYNETTEDNY